MMTDGELLLTAASLSVEVVEEGGDALKCGLALAFDFNLEGDAGLADTAQVGYLVQLGHHTQTAAHGHFGRDIFPWERLDRVAPLKKLFKIA